MVLDFSSIRPHLQQNVLYKLTFLEFSCFSKCSKNSQLVSKSLKRRLPLEKKKADLNTHGLIYLTKYFQRIKICQIVNKFPVRIHFSEIVFQESFSKENCMKTIECFGKGKIKTRKITFTYDMSRMTPEDFNQLLKVSQVEEFFSEIIYVDYLCQPETERIPKFQFFHIRERIAGPDIELEDIKDVKLKGLSNWERNVPQWAT